jgi:hypothetical protein
MKPLRCVVGVISLVSFLLGNHCCGQAEFRLGIEGRPDDRGFRIESLVAGSPLLVLRGEDGQISSAEPGDSVTSLNFQQFSPEVLRAMRQDLLSSSGVVDLELLDARTGNTFVVSAILNRTDTDPQFERAFREIVREEYAGVKPIEVEISEGPDRVTGVRISDAFVPPSGEGPSSPISMLVACQAGITQLQKTARANRFEKMIPAGTYVRAEKIIENAITEVSLNPNGEHALTIAENAQEAVIDEVRASFEGYAQRNGKEWRERGTFGAGFIVFDPKTVPTGMTVEVIPSADIKLVLLRDPRKTDADLDQLSGWTPLPLTEASLYGRFYFRLRNPQSSQLLFGYQKQKLVVVRQRPANGEVLFQ